MAFSEKKSITCIDKLSLILFTENEAFVCLFSTGRYYPFIIRENDILNVTEARLTTADCFPFVKQIIDVSWPLMMDTEYGP